MQNESKAVFIKNIVIMTLVLAIMAAFLTGCGNDNQGLTMSVLIKG